MIKALINQIVVQTFSRLNYPLLINSYGRSGSTVLTRSIVKGAITTQNALVRKAANRSISQAAWNLESASLKNGIVYKTHDYPPANNKIKKNTRMLYTFADPVDVVLSLLRIYNKRGEGWMRQHYQHLQISYNNFDGILDEDHLKLEKHLSSWLNEDRFPIAFIKYESMWDHQHDISEFLGFQVKLPPFRQRKAKDRKDQLPVIEDTYAHLQKKIKQMPSFFMSQ